MFFVSMKGLELSCTLPTWLSVHQTDDKSTSIMCTGHKTPMDCCCWLQTYTYPKAEIIFILPPKVRTIIFFSLLWWGDGVILIKCSLTIRSRCCTLSVTAVCARPSRVNLA